MTALTPTHLSTVLAAEERTRDLPAPPWVLGVVAFGVLVALLLVTLSFNRDR